MSLAKFLLCSTDYSTQVRNMPSIENLPDEIILHIFRYLSLREWLILQQVNHRWHRIASDRTLFNTLSFTEDAPNSLINSVLHRFGDFVHNVSLVGLSDIDVLAPSIFECKDLKSLSVKLCTGNGDAFLSGIENSTKMDTLIVQHTPVQKMNELLKILSARPMKKISVRNMDADILEDDLSSLRAVKDLRLKSIRVHANAIYQFCSHNTEFLTTLKLIVCDDASWVMSSENLNETVFQAIGNCRKLESLCLGPQVTSSLNDGGFSHITKLERLSTFQIHNAISVSCSAFRTFFCRPSALNLRKISLHKCPSVDSTVLLEISKGCRQLEKFTLEKSKVCSNKVKDVHDIVVLVQNCSGIRQLHLYGMDINVAHALHLTAKYLPELESLKYSNSSNPMDIPSFLSALQKLLPDFEVCGMQWTYNLYVHCKKKKYAESRTNDDLVCGKALKMQPVYN